MTNVVINYSHFDVSLINDDASIEKIEFSNLIDLMFVNKNIHRKLFVKILSDYKIENINSIC